jgi:hypothetical protein
VDTFAVWWLSPSDRIAIGSSLPEAFPEGVRLEFLSLQGRNGRGRLWIPDGYPDDIRCVFPEVKLTALESYLGAYCAGVVFRPYEPVVGAALHRYPNVIELVRAEYPGVVTDLNLRRML